MIKVTERSKFIQKIIQEENKNSYTKNNAYNQIPKKIIQFWDNFNLLPDDVKECIDTWKEVENIGIERQLFDSNQAQEFISYKLGSRYIEAYNNCYHPAMQSDYFRLCYIFIEGGCYIDADDVFEAIDIQKLFADDRLKIQPLCYDLEKNEMVNPSLFTKYGAYKPQWIFYFNNNPIISIEGHPVIELALENATQNLERDMSIILPDIQSTAGPGNLSDSVFNILRQDIRYRNSIYILNDWEDIATSKWPLSYRNDQRNWRLSDCKKFEHSTIKATL